MSAPLCSWGSGADLWGSEADGRFSRPRIDDGLLEVVGVTGVVHMVRCRRVVSDRLGLASLRPLTSAVSPQGQVQSGLRCGIRIAQGSYIRLIVSKELPVQVDGEPWLQAPGHIIISAAGPKVPRIGPAGSRSSTRARLDPARPAGSLVTGSIHPS